MAEQCKVGGRFSRCPNEAVNTCQYCGRAFCAAHAIVNAKVEAVCARKPCKRKYDDLVLHLEYRERTAQRNHAGLCGVESCGPHPRAECSLCEGLFCEQHLSPRLYPLRMGTVVIDQPMSVCDWCWRRRKVWRH
ncbi:MAG: hypothetical protein HYX53_15535 [Chloroflexi bacterium]|nr:hypothetical protein [Chloroflexota bacterium]